MGAIASVLQWHCEKCSLINPTEHSKCLRCGAHRRQTNNCDEQGDGDGDTNKPNCRGVESASGEHHSSGTIFGSNANCTVIRRPRRIPQNNQSIVVENDSCSGSQDEPIYAVVNKENKKKYRLARAQKCSRIKRSHSAVYLNIGIEGGKRFSSTLQLANCWRCDTCSIVNTTISDHCFGCDNILSNNREVLKLASTVDRMSIARCTKCSSRYDYTITPVEQTTTTAPHSVLNNANALLLHHKYELLNYGARKPFCNCPQQQPSMISLSNISTYNCVPSTNCERFLGTAVCSSSTSPKRHTSLHESFRTKVSRSVSNDSVTVKPLPLMTSTMAMPETWTCSNCTLVNMSTALVCEACETPHRLDVNKNTKNNTSSVVIKVDNWDEQEESSSNKFLLPKPSYRRSLSEIPQTQFHSHSTNVYKCGANRRSLGDGILEAATNKSAAAAVEYPTYAKQHNALNRMCNSISSNILGSAVPNVRPNSCDHQSFSSSSDSKPLYTYIGITEPTISNISNSSNSSSNSSGHHLYENHLALKETKLTTTSNSNTKDFKSSPIYNKRVQESMYVKQKSNRDRENKRNINVCVCFSNQTSLSELCKRMWTCRKCSYAYNAIWTEHCDICTCPRSPPSLSQPSLITVTKEETALFKKRDDKCLQHNK